MYVITLAVLFLTKFCVLKMAFFDSLMTKRMFKEEGLGCYNFVNTKIHFNLSNLIIILFLDTYMEVLIVFIYTFDCLSPC